MSTKPLKYVLTSSDLAPSALTSKGLMNFFQALRLTLEGHKITRVVWGTDETYGLIESGLLKLQKPDGLHNWIVSDGDMTALDWIVIE